MIIFFDIDGTLTTTISGELFGKHPRDYRLINGVEEVLENLPNCIFTGITNQLGVGYGYKTLHDCIEEQRFKLSLMPWLGEVIFCPDDEGKTAFHVWGDRCEKVGYDEHYGTYRKPATGMLKLALYRHGQEHLKGSWMIGDRQDNCDAARNLGISFAWATQWRKGKVQVPVGGSLTYSPH